MDDLTLTARIDGTGPNSARPDRPDAINATIFSNEKQIGEVTLIRNDDGNLAPWGDMGSRTDWSLMQWLGEREDEGESIDDLVFLVVDAVCEARRSTLS